VLQPVREVAVVGEQEQPLGLHVQPADVEQALVPVADQVTEVGPALVVLHGRDHADGLVDGEVHLRGVDLDPQAVDVDDLRGPDTGPELGDDLVVDRHPPQGDQLLRPAAGGDTGLGQDLLQPLPLRVVDVGGGTGALGDVRDALGLAAVLAHLAAVGRTRARAARVPGARGPARAAGCLAGRLLAPAAGAGGAHRAAPAMSSSTSASGR
jgi:hypothetical protein